MFLIRPQTLIGKLEFPCAPNEPPESEYAEVRSAYGTTPHAEPQWFDYPIPTLSENASEIGAKVVSELLSRCEISDPEALVDCRSATMLDGPAPTYRLAAGCSLRKATCWSLSGVGGVEVAEALIQVRGLGVHTAVVSAVQTVRFPDTRVIPAGYPLGDAVAATLASLTRPLHGRSWRIRACLLRQLGPEECINPQHIRSLLTCACAIEGVSERDVRWRVTQHLSDHFKDCVARAFPKSTRELRSRTPSSVNFGCADTLVTLTMSADTEGLGALVMAGRFGAFGIVLLDD